MRFRLVYDEQSESYRHKAVKTMNRMFHNGMLIHCGVLVIRGVSGVLYIIISDYWVNSIWNFLVFFAAVVLVSMMKKYKTNLKFAWLYQILLFVDSVFLIIEIAVEVVEPIYNTLLVMYILILMT